MTCAIVGCGPTGKDWFKNPYDISIGVNDAGKWGKDFDHLVVINALDSFKKEQDRVKIIKDSKALVHTNEPSWQKVLKNVHMIRLTPFHKYLKRGHYYYSKSSPFVALSVAFNLGATKIIIHGVDMNDHPLFNPSNKARANELLHMNKLCRLMSEQGVSVYVSSQESALSSFLEVYKPIEV